MLRAPEHHNGNALPTTLAEFVESCAIQTHRIQIIEMPSKRPGEEHEFGQQHRVSGSEAEQHIIGLVDFYREAAPSHSAHAVLVGFDLSFEFRLFSTIYTGLASYFTSWLDLQELSRLASGMSQPGLSQTLKACVFGLQDPADLQSGHGKHNAATDTVRAAAVFHHLLTRDDDQELRISTGRSARALARQYRSKPSWGRDRKLWHDAQAAPGELGPHIARVKRSRKQILPPETLLKVFAEYDPVAAGTHEPSMGRQYGWVCLPTFRDLKRFVRAVNGSEHPQGGIWMAVSSYDPDVIPAEDMCELKARLHTRAAEKREERRMKRLAGGPETDLDDVEEF